MNVMHPQRHSLVSVDEASDSIKTELQEMREALGRRLPELEEYRRLMGTTMDSIEGQRQAVIDAVNARADYCKVRHTEKEHVGPNLKIQKHI